MAAQFHLADLFEIVAGAVGAGTTPVSRLQVRADDFRDADLILAMDWENLSALQQQCPKVYQHKLMLLMRFSNEFEEATVPDPYYGGPEGFNKVLDYIEDSCQGVLELVRKRALQYQAA